MKNEKVKIKDKSKSKETVIPAKAGIHKKHL